MESSAKWGSNSPGSPGFVEFYGMCSHYSRKSYYKLHCKCHKGEGNRCPGKPWANAWVAHLPSVWRATATVEGSQAVGKSSLSKYNEVVITKNTDTMDAFSSHVIPMKAKKVYTGGRINVITQALQVKDGSLPQGLTMQNVYTELRTGRKNAVVVVRNSTAYPQTLKKETLVAQVVAATIVPELLAMTNWLEGVGELHSPQTPKLTIRRRQDKLFEELDLSGLESWLPELADST